MAEIWNRIERVNGQAASGAIVTVSLSWDTDVQSVARTDEGQFFIGDDAKTQTDGSGEWTMDVIPNGDITPADSVYKVTEVIDSDTTRTYYVSVPNGATPSYWVGGLLADTPEWEA